MKSFYVLTVVYGIRVISAWFICCALYPVINVMDRYLEIARQSTHNDKLLNLLYVIYHLPELRILAISDLVLSVIFTVSIIFVVITMFVWMCIGFRIEQLDKEKLCHT